MRYERRIDWWERTPREERAARALGLHAARARLRESLLPFLAFREVYPRPRISVETADTVIASAGQAQITLADLDAMAKEIER